MPRRAGWGGCGKEDGARMEGESPGRLRQLRIAEGPSREGDVWRSGVSTSDGLEGCGEIVRCAGRCYTGNVLRHLYS